MTNLTDDERIAQRFMIAKNYDECFEGKNLVKYFKFTIDSFLSMFIGDEQEKIQEIRDYLDAHSEE